MQTTPVFRNAPVVEALLDIRADLPPSTTLPVLASFHDHISAEYPARGEKHEWSGGLKVSAGAAEIIPPTGGTAGYLFKSADSKQIVQARLDGFTFNKLKPYKDWETFSQEATRLWELYRQIAKPMQVTRLALRYINKIELPITEGELKDYLHTVPELAPGLTYGLAGFFMRLLIPNPRTQAVAIVTEANGETLPPNNELHIILDIDTYRQMTWQPTDPQIWVVMNQLREFKNEIFLKSTTARCQEFFK
jgi:uncharacterized protein (TIGR04255 family)